MRLGAYLSALAEPPLPVLITVTLFGWVVMLQEGHAQGMPEFLMAIQGNGYSQSSQALHTLLHSNLLVMVGWSWLIMLVAMMTPLLADPIRHLWVRSLPRRRWLAVVLFLAGYITIWMMAGVVLMLFTLLLWIFSWFPTLFVALALAIAWQTTPWKQACLNHCHWTPRLSPFGLAANWDCLRYGMANGLWCVGACWALMLLPLATVHVYSMLMVAIATGLILVVERYRPARPARWQVPLLEGIRLRTH
ncbi:DUF2182 domain-containing protein [Aetokthonos hydrillicola Thurmond2011]|jgi:predicted metal-binding membrane protein|uniref:DUF2182 domain-containing protein n=1 Tax=Aetokthonos hydrillicola Thurmond2011 TaxID=2712845 RepID=A0AAP5IDY6_9CYAN|nr:DUF2182 domain-containing protein [Aetokthonos hydrillicola]MBO3460751.1 DUF2182 domain-containing protein [Aetokthonos hydrillicola CCALA 1050]MBW4586390.1 DUF2182 domain-containing protein [Aetokthonos hydrillicola CCALA 1050]MDR9899905.1 DUF2182 domain-containing protein [Aetokthonos hydrillicola Thurmond2011]